MNYAVVLASDVPDYTVSCMATGKFVAEDENEFYAFGNFELSGFHTSTQASNLPTDAVLYVDHDSKLGIWSERPVGESQLEFYINPVSMVF